MSNKITRPIRLEKYQIENKRDDHREKASPSGKAQREKLKKRAIGMLCLALGIGVVVTIIGVPEQDSVQLAIFAVAYIPITIALRSLGKISKWKNLLNFLSIANWIVFILVSALILFPIK